MIRALLLDLDDTLLQSNFDQFLPAYLSRIAAELAPHDPPDVVIGHLTEATGAMMANLDPTQTLKEAFDRRFYPALGVSEADLRPQIDRFYQQTYPQLRSMTSPAAHARELVEAAIERGLELVLATNPLFPRTAIEQRMDWAGLADCRPEFSLITCYESAHFAKPQPEYYAEILGRLGVAPEAAAMIGDDPENDLAPARSLGLATFHVSSGGGNGHADGDLRQAQSWLLSRIEDRPEEPEAGRPPRAVLGRMRGHLAALLSLAEALEATWHEPPEQKWGTGEVICHLRDVELEVHQPRLHELLNEEPAFLSAADPDRWAQERNYRAQDPGAALDSFVAARKGTLTTLASLPEEAWSTPARHALLGPTTLAELMDLAADHDLSHLAQLRDLLEAS